MAARFNPSLKGIDHAPVGNFGIGVVNIQGQKKQWNYSTDKGKNTELQKEPEILFLPSCAIHWKRGRRSIKSYHSRIVFPWIESLCDEV
jgi:hypothetical protein